MTDSISNSIPATYSTAIYSAISLSSLYIAYRLFFPPTSKPTPVLPASEMKTVVIIGGSYGGITTAHKLLKGSASTGDIKVILVSPNTHLYWNVATVRAIIPGSFADDKLLAPIVPGFKQYKADKFEFVVGKAESIDVANKKVSISSSTGTNSLSYDTLVLATGSHTKSEAPWKALDTYDETVSALHSYQSKVKKATSIVIVGAGSTGVETAGELGFSYGTSKKITLIASGSTVLEGTPSSVSKTAIKLLKNLHVNLVLSTKVVGDAKLPDGRTELTLSSGEKITTDLYLPTMGLAPNSSFIPSSLLSPTGFVISDEYLRAKGTPDIFAVGDVSSIQRPQIINTMKQAEHAAKNIAAALKGADLEVYKIGGGDTLAVTVGKKAGTGHTGNWKLPGFMIVMLKAKTLFTQNLEKVVDGRGM